MTKKEVLQMFKKDILPQIRQEYEADGRVDHPARREAWNNYVDYLAQDKLITWDQADGWSNPF